MMKIDKFFRLIVWLLCLTGCSESLVMDHPATKDDKLEVLDIQFDEIYKTFHVDVKVKDDFAPEKLIPMTELRIEGKELRMDMKEVVDKVQPQFLGAENIKSKRITEAGLKVLILVDLTLGDKEVENQRIAVNNLRSLFDTDHLYVSFMKGGSVTESYPLTDYVIENFFVAEDSSKKLYRSILSKIDEMNGRKSTYFPKVEQNAIWESVPAEKKRLLVFSDGQVYEENKPIDADHFELQRKLLNQSKGDMGFPVYYVNFAGEEQEEVEIENEAENLVTYLCEQTGGSYFPSFVWVSLSHKMVDGLNVGEVDFRFRFMNPDQKVYRGIKRWLCIDCYHQDSLILTAHKSYSLGSLYRPIIVNGIAAWRIYVQGGFVFVCLLFVVYLVFQFVVPKVSYELFRKRYVKRYTGKNMSVNNIQIGEICYYCKAPFEQGEEVVAKCSHVMHKSCWDENEYKCPEYGRRCKEGSHYYNVHHLFDLKNAPYYMNWLLMGICAGAFSWFFFMLNAWQVGYDWLVNSLFKLSEIDPQSETAKNLLDKFGNELFNTPYFGLYICFFVTFFLSILSSHGKWWWKRLSFVLVKAILAGLGGYLTFVVVAFVSLALGIVGDFLLIDWIPWTMNGFLIAFAVSYKTDIKLYKALVGATISILFTLGSMYIWRYSHGSQVDTRDLLLISCLIYSVGIAISLAVNFPRSERYFLRVEGPIKTMEIAIYKWMNSQYIHRKVTIGKSVDCNLQMSWDINSDISPVQAEIVSKGGYLYLIALEKGVYIKGKQVKLENEVQLYHGDQFKIGQTLFTYVEHDV